MVKIDGDWRTVSNTIRPTHYTATGTKGEAIELRLVRSPSHRTERWYLTVTLVDGIPDAVEIGPSDPFDTAEVVLRAWGALVVHVLRRGYALCSTMSHPPSSWPHGHVWIAHDDRANLSRERESGRLCGGCLDVSEGRSVPLECRPGYRPRDIPMPDGSDVAHRHTSDAHDGVIECASNGNVLDLRCQPGYRFELAPSDGNPTLVSVWLVRS